jgi:membrane associated rhomboid family serine protease
MRVMEDNYRKQMGLGQDGNALVKLIVFNAVLFVILKFIYIIFISTSLNTEAYYKNIFAWFVLPADLGKLATRPWTILTYMFADEKVFRFIANMFWLWSFGYIMQDLTGNRKLIPVYIYGGIAGALYFSKAAGANSCCCFAWRKPGSACDCSSNNCCSA